MCGGGGRPKQAAKTPEAAQLPTQTSEERTSDRDRRRRRAGGGTSGTILTSSSGVDSTAQTDQKTLLGS